MKFKKLPFTEHAQFVFKSILAAVLIAMAGGIFLLCTNTGTIQDPFLAKVVGSFLFSLGLCVVIALQANLYTGKIGYVNSKHLAIRAFWMLFINLGIAFLIGWLFRGVNTSIPSFGQGSPFGPDSTRLSKAWYQFLFDGFGCGVLIYLAVELYRKTRSFLPVIMCVMAFILSGAEHCIADAFYLGASQFSWEALGDLGLAIIGNTFGSIAIHWLQVGAEYLNELPNNIQR